jgi:hypothetical protein
LTELGKRRSWLMGLPALLSVRLASLGPAFSEAATQESLVGAGSGKAQGELPGALGGGVSADAEMKLADHRVPNGITGGNESWLDRPTRRETMTA